MSCSIYKLDDTYTIEALIKWIDEGQLIIPIIQRKAVWEPEHALAYINFLLKHSHGVIPIIVNRRIYNNTLKYFLYDGNNRCTTLYKFVTSPLEDDWKILGSILEVLEVQPNYTLDVSAIFLEMKAKQFGIMDLNYNFNIEGDDTEAKHRVIIRMRKALPAPQQELFDKTLEKLRNKYKSLKNANSKDSRLFTMINIPVGIFDNCSNEAMYDIYKSLNKGTKVMSEQDLLFPILYSYEVTDLDDPSKEIISKGVALFYDKRNDSYKYKNNTEKLEANYKFNLYFCLIGLQRYIDDKYETVIKPVETTDKVLPPMFNLFDIIVLKKRLTSINDTDMPTINQFSTFMKNIIKIMDNLILLKDSINNQFIGSNKLPNLGLIATCFLGFVCYIYNTEFTPELQILCKRIITFNLFSSVKNVDMRDKFKRANILHLDGGGLYRRQMCINTIQKSPADRLTELKTLQDSVFRELFKTLLDERLKPEPDSAKKQRTKPQTFYNFVMGIYFNRNISRHHASSSTEFEIEHIFAYKSSWPSATPIDINRLGNLVWLPKKLNRSKGKNIIQESQLYKDLDIEAKRQIHTQFGYPELDVCRRIWDCSSESIISAEEYNKFCSSREDNYMNSFINYLSTV